ncbi:hypothetical protein NIES37_08220 [Tolypothrix tenuis PCC 7101]|uniref:HNH endonuclease n=1 Tax=Tolypothrix tenuis PCC 7101 TaxID=231146 RepID=A0A1Z4MTS5_9CYAN|nr:HNH endonuclease [Aulosira sp. FACHB-113]BAY96885.1 hypothetical protein NIES37_08220 [Tolypothrix tenuis PCC 7101]BAZ72607.1 hypothetical protein NIES50_11610 [Aulosira laxa NIES-50]
MSNQYFNYDQIIEKCQQSNSIPTYEDLLLALEWRNKRDEILRRDNHSCVLCQQKEFLHIHHTYYLKLTLPWNYPNESLITLCEKCHDKIHKQIKVPVFEIVKGYYVDTNSQPCHRCNGTGRFPEFKHRDNGICYRCRGARYEELIGVSTGKKNNEIHQIAENLYPEDKDNYDEDEYDENGYYKSLTKIEYYGYEIEYENLWDKADRLYGVPDPRLLSEDDKFR